MDLNKDEAILVIDYKIKILPKTACETKQEFFRKKDWHYIQFYLVMPAIEIRVSDWVDSVKK